MFASVQIEAEGFGRVVHVPREAVIRGGAPWIAWLWPSGTVAIRHNRSVWASSPVTELLFVAVCERAKRFVVSGQFLIDSESNIESALARMGDAGEETPEEMDPEMDHSQHQMDDEL